MSIVPTTAIPAAAAAPTVDGAGGRRRVHRRRRSTSARRGSGTEHALCRRRRRLRHVRAGRRPDNSTYAKVTRSGDDLYFFVHVRDDFQSYAVKPSECVAHWLADSVEILIDPRGNASRGATRTRRTRSSSASSRSPNDPTGSQRQRRRTARAGSATPTTTRATRPGRSPTRCDDAPNAPGRRGRVDARRGSGRNETTTDHAYAGGGYDLEVKIPLADLPAAVDPDHMGLNITPYDKDDTAAAGTTTLRHIDQSTRLAWSTFGSVQSDPYRWGHATLPGYTPPAGRPTTPPTPNARARTWTASTRRRRSRSRRATACRSPAATRRRGTTGSRPSTPSSAPSAAALDLRTTGTGPRARVPVVGRRRATSPVWVTSCAARHDDPPPDYGLTACALGRRRQSRRGRRT